MIEALQRALPELVLWGTALSVLSLVAVIIAVPWVVSRLPVDYFSSQHRHPLREQMGITAMIMALLKNLLGMVLVLLGLVMLFTPGQGLLMTLVGLLIMNFPGKYRLERALVAREGVFKGLNWMRSKQSLPPFESPRGRSAQED